MNDDNTYLPQLAENELQISEPIDNIEKATKFLVMLG